MGFLFWNFFKVLKYQSKITHLMIFAYLIYCMIEIISFNPFSVRSFCIMISSIVSSIACSWWGMTFRAIYLHMAISIAIITTVVIVGYSLVIRIKICVRITTIWCRRVLRLITIVHTVLYGRWMAPMIFSWWTVML